MKNEIPPIIFKRVFLFALVLIAVLVLLDKSAFESVLEEQKHDIVLNELRENKKLYDNLNILFGRVEDDFIFFEKEILNILQLEQNSLQYESKVNSLLSFLETHPGYFKLRITNASGQELFKLIQNRDFLHFEQSRQLYDLSSQDFFKELDRVERNEFVISSLEPNIIGGVREFPLRPTVRISKRIGFQSRQRFLLILNINGEKILSLFKSTNQDSSARIENALLDGSGFYIAKYPDSGSDLYLHKKRPFVDIVRKINQVKDQQGYIEFGDELIVFTRILLPNSDYKWLLLNRFSKKSMEDIVLRKRLTWIFWGLVCILVLLVWFFKQEKKRYYDEVVQVLLIERSEFIQNVSHQLKTPLAIMLNTLSKDKPNEHEINDTKKEVKHLAKIVDDMLILALVDSHPSIPLKSENILEVLINAIDMTASKATNRKIKINLNVDESLQESSQDLERSVMGDLLTSGLVNIIDNAIDFSPDGGVVNVLISKINSKISIVIKDHGPGISEDLLPKLFNRFHLINNRNRKGSGLGLSITKKILELHRGEIRLVEYRNGTTFEILIP